MQQAEHGPDDTSGTLLEPVAGLGDQPPDDWDDDCGGADGDDAS